MIGRLFIGRSHCSHSAKISLPEKVIVRRVSKLQFRLMLLSIFSTVKRQLRPTGYYMAGHFTSEVKVLPSLPAPHLPAFHGNLHDTINHSNAGHRAAKRGSPHSKEIRLSKAARFLTA